MTEADATRTGVTESRPFIDGLFFGECPRWHDGRLWYVDFYRSTVFSADEAGASRVEVEVPGEPAGLGWLPDGRLLVVARRPRTVMRLEPDGQLALHGDLKPTATFYGNDMVVDLAGRCLRRQLRVRPAPGHRGTGRAGADGAARTPHRRRGAHRSRRLGPSGRHRPLLSQRDGDHPRRQGAHRGRDPGRPASPLSTWARTGSSSGRRVWASLPWCPPDGICLDADGRVWVANAIAPNACSWPRVARSWTGFGPPRPASPACWGVPTGGRST